MAISPPPQSSPLNHFPPSAPICPRLAKLSFLILEGIIKKI